MSWNTVHPQNIQITSRSIGSFTATVTMEEVGNDELEITEHPVQEGAAITDHAFVKPSKLNIKAYFDNSMNDLNTIYQNLLALQSSRQPFTVVTGKRTYNNMLFKSLRQDTDNTTENTLSIYCEFQQVIIVSIATTSVPPVQNQANPQSTQSTQKAGEKNAETVDPNSNTGSSLNSLANNVTRFFRFFAGGAG